MGNPFDRFDKEVKGNPFDQFGGQPQPELGNSPVGTPGGYDPVVPLGSRASLKADLAALGKGVPDKALADARAAVKRENLANMQGTNKERADIRAAYKSPNKYNAPVEEQAASDDLASRNILGDQLALGFGQELTHGLDQTRTGIMNFFGRGPGYSGKVAADAAQIAGEERNNEYRDRRPKAAMADAIAGAAISPANRVGGSFIRGASGLIPLMGRSAVVGGTIGGVTGFGNADGSLGDRTKAAGAGATLGAAVGAAAPVLVKAGQTVVAPIGKAAGGVTSEIVDGAKRLFTGSTVAEQARVPSPAQAEKATNAAVDYVRNMGAKPDKLRAAAALAEGKPITAAEAIGPNAISQVSAMSRRAGNTPELAEGILSARSQQRADRILGDVAQTTGINPAAARGDIESLVQAGQKQAAPLYEAALSAPDPVQAPVFGELAKRPVIKRALNSVAQDIMNEGGDPTAYGLVRRVESVPGGGSRDVWDEVAAPNAKTWDMVKKAVGRQVERNPITGRPLPDSQSEGNFGVSTASRDLTAAMREHIPGYKEALDVSGDYLSLDNAYGRAKGLIFKAGNNTGDFANFFNGLGSEAERNAVRSRMANDIYEQAQNGRLNPRQFATPAVQQKLAIAFGEDNAKRISMRVQIEAKMAAAESRMRPNLNSITGDVMAQGEAENNMGEAGLKAAGQLMTGNPKGAGLSLLSALRAPIRGAQTGGNQYTRDEVGRLLLEMSPEELAAYLEKAPLSELPGIIPYLGVASGHLPAPQPGTAPRN